MMGFGVFPGRLFGHIGGAGGEAVYFQSYFFCWDILTDPAYHGRIIISNSYEVENRWPMPDDIQSFMPHLGGLVLLGSRSVGACTDKDYRSRRVNCRYRTSVGCSAVGKQYFSALDIQLIIEAFDQGV